MKKSIKYLRLCNALWVQLGYHVFMNHWQAARNISKRINRMKANRLWVRLLTFNL